MPVAVVQDYTAEQWCELWSLEAKARNDLWEEWNKVRKERDELLAEIKRLQDWKESQMAVESEWDAQMLAKKLGAPIGSSCRKEIQERVLSLIEENKRLTELLDACTIHSCGDHCQRPTCKRAMQNAIKDAYWQLLPFLKPGDEKTKAVLERLQKFL